MRRVVLLGDSIFDNAAYVAGGPDVIKQVQALNYAAASETALFLLVFSFGVLALTYGMQRRVWGDGARTLPQATRWQEGAVDATQ